MMDRVFLALAAAFFLGLAKIFIKRGLVANPYPTVAAVVSLSVNVAFFLTLVLITSQVIFTGPGIWYFVLAGMLAPGTARILSYKGVERLGASIVAPLVSMETLFSFGLAIVFLKEKITTLIILGVGSICLGVIILAGETGAQRNILDRFMRNKRYLLFPLVAAGLYGTSIFLRKLGLDEGQSPIIGATITSASSWILVTALLSRGSIRRDFIQLNRKGVTCFLLSGGCTSLAWLFYFHALSISKVVSVTPIVNSHSLITVFLGFIFLKDVERVNHKIAGGAFLVVLGIFLISMND